MFEEVLNALDTSNEEKVLRLIEEINKTDLDNFDKDGKCLLFLILEKYVLAISSY